MIKWSQIKRTLTVQHVDLLAGFDILKMLNKAKKNTGIIAFFAGILKRCSRRIMYVFQEGKLSLVDNFFEEVNSAVRYGCHSFRINVTLWEDNCPLNKAQPRNGE